MAKTDPAIEIELVHAVHVESIPAADPFSYVNVYSQMRESVLQQGQEIISKAKNELSKVPNKSSAYVIEGHPSNVILEYAKNHGCDLIIMGSRGLSGLKEVFLGSVSHSVAQCSSIPVLIIK